MKLSLCGVAVAASFYFVHAQETAAPNQSIQAMTDLDVMIQALEATPPLPATAAAGTFYSAQHAPNTAEPWPPMPTDFLGLPVWPLGGDYYLMDDTGVNYAQASPSPSAMLASPLNLQAQFTSDDLWLQINGVTNDGTGWAANLTINKPLNDTTLTYDLFYTPSLDSPINWQFLMRCVSTNVIAPGLCASQAFFRLGQTNGSLTVSTDVTALQLAQLLVPSWVTNITNAKFTGTNVARGTFAGGNGCGLPLESGVILATVPVTNAIGPNNDSGYIASYVTQISNFGETNGG